MKTAAQPIDVSILRFMRSSRSASVFSPGHFDGLGSAAAIRQTLKRLVKSAKIRQIRRGLYDLPRQHPSSVKPRRTSWQTSFVMKLPESSGNGRRVACP
jgi:hypothetical protein